MCQGRAAPAQPAARHEENPQAEGEEMKRLLAIALLLPAPLLAQQPRRVESKRVVKPHVRVRDAAKSRQFWLTVAGIFASSTFDAESTARCITHHPQCQEANPVFGPRPSRKRLYGIKFGINTMQ